jgi:hypothetical protein
MKPGCLDDSDSDVSSVVQVLILLLTLIMSGREVTLEMRLGKYLGYLGIVRSC